LLSSELREFACGSEFVIRILGRLLKTEEDSRDGKVGTERLLGNQEVQGFLTIRWREVRGEVGAMEGLVEQVVTRLLAVVEGVNSIDSFSVFFVWFVDDIEVVVAVVLRVDGVVVLPDDWLMPQLGFADCWSLLQG